MTRSLSLTAIKANPALQHAGEKGFQRLVSDVGLGRAGIVMGLEESRNNADWHRLLEIGALSTIACCSGSRTRRAKPSCMSSKLDCAVVSSTKCAAENIVAPADGLQL
jgi:hypothetical protein